jgi:hypothetical protein
LKRGITRKLVTSIKNSVCKLMIIQKILSVTIPLLKRSSLNLKLKLSVILQYMLQLKTKTITILSHALHAIYLHTTKNRKRTIITLVASVIFILNLFFFTVISGQVLVRTNMYSYGSIQIQTAGVTAYKDASCTTLVTEFPWGSLAPGSSGTNIIYLKNEGHTSLTLSLNTTNWNPTNAPNYITLNWNYNGQTIAPNQVIQIIFTLSVSQNISGINSFSFEIIIDGTG